MTPTPNFLLATDADAAALAARVGDLLPVGEAVEAGEQTIYLDTFDWRLWRRGHLLVHRRGDDGRWLVWASEGEQVSESRLDRPPSSATDLPPGPIAEALGDLVAPRVLLPVVKVHRHSRVLPVLDDEQKTVARIRVEERSAAVGRRRRQPLPSRLRLEPLRGYESELEAIVGALTEAIELVATPDEELAEALAPFDRAPGDYRSKPRLDLDPDQPAGEAVKAILAKLLTTMTRNEEGIRGDVDPEFLHDFRVAVRRSRAALGQLKKVLPASEVDRFRRQLSWLGQGTGPARDLDVLVLELDGYSALVGTAARDPLAELAPVVERRRRTAYRRVVRALDSARYRRFVRSWGDYLSRPPGEATDSTPIGELAARRIRRTAKRTLREAGAIGKDSEEAAFHRLRIRSKKLRYLLEFFRPLFDAGEIDPSLRLLKRLQDRLGLLQDLTVHAELLDGLARGAGAKLSPAGLLAIGRLLAALDERRQANRAEILRALKAFRRGAPRCLTRLAAPGGGS